MNLFPRFILSKVFTVQSSIYLIFGRYLARLAPIFCTLFQYCNFRHFADKLYYILYCRVLYCTKKSTLCFCTLLQKYAVRSVCIFQHNNPSTRIHPTLDLLASWNLAHTILSRIHQRHHNRFLHCCNKLTKNSINNEQPTNSH